MALIDITGKRFGKLLVLSRAQNSPARMARWNCACDCGKKKVIAGAYLRTGRSRSCGCGVGLAATKQWTTHGGTKTRLYRAWIHMRERCRNPNAVAYEHYGGRGITVCDRWNKSFAAFEEDMGHPKPGQSIDRIDNAKGYFKENCRWATKKQQSRNTRRNKQITQNGKTQSLRDWAEELGLSHRTIQKRLRLGWSPQQALTPKLWKIKNKLENKHEPM